MEKKEQNLAFQKAWAKIVAKAWSDSNLKEKLLKNPKEVFKSCGINLPQDVEISVVENTEKKIYLVLPTKVEGELSEEVLNKIAAGSVVTSSVT